MLQRGQRTLECQFGIETGLPASPNASQQLQAGALLGGQPCRILPWQFRIFVEMLACSKQRGKVRRSLPTFLSPLDLMPRRSDFQDPLLRVLVRKNMRVTAHKFVGEDIDHITDGEFARLSGNPTMQHDLKENVPQFVCQIVWRSSFDCQDRLVCFFQKVRA